MRGDRIDSVSQWYWLKQDNGAWDGPKEDWEESHRDKYFKNVKKFDLVVQAGGCLGMYPRLLSDIFDMVYTFEPDALNFYCLNLNCQKSNIIKFNCALGAEHQTISLNRTDEENVGTFRVIDEGNDKIPVLRLDDLGLQACDMLCLDIEGYEINALMGATNTILMFKPVIVCERANTTVTNFLEAMGYIQQEDSKMDTIFIPKDINGEDIL